MTIYTQQYLLLIDLLYGSTLNSTIISSIDLICTMQLKLSLDGVTEFHNRKYVARYICNAVNTAIKEKLPISICFLTRIRSVSHRKLL